MFATYLKEKKELPPTFKQSMAFKGFKLDISPDCVEKQYEIELFENVVVHFTPDVHGKNWVGDLKTTSRGIDSYKSDKQTTFYAMVLGKLGLNIEWSYYFGELWDKQRENIQGYEVLVKKIRPKEKEDIKEWAKKRIELLFEELKKYRR
jgi:hypothetical protein